MTILALFLFGQAAFATASFVVLPPIPFENDTILTCESIIDTLHLSSGSAVNITGISFTGTDGSSFQLLGSPSRSLPKDSLIRILCSPKRSGDLSAGIHIVAQDGTIIDVPIQIHVEFAPLLLSQPSFFNGDSLSICSSQSDSLVLFSACPITLQSITIIGQDSLSFKLIGSGATPSPDDSTITISCTPLRSGDLNAMVRILLPDGTTKDIPISIFINDEPSLTIESTPQVICDTIGGDVMLRFVFHQRSIPTATELTIRYDSTILVYHGFVDQNGVDQTINRPNEGSARIRFKTTDDSVLYALFSFYPGDSSCTTVFLDSINLFNTAAQCVHIDPGLLSAQICTSIACGRTYLTRYAHHGGVLRFWIVPTPSNGEAVLHSDMPIKLEELSITDIRGMTSFISAGATGNQTSFPLHLQSLAPGSYFLHVNGQGNVIPLIISK